MGLPLQEISVTVVLDLNVILDFLLEREQFVESAEVLVAASEGKIDAVIPLHGITTIYYFLRKERGDSASRALLKDVLKAARIVSISDLDVRTAIESRIPDLEDAIVAETAAIVKADYILTRDIRGFANAPVPAISPLDFLKKHGRTLR